MGSIKNVMSNLPTNIFHNLFKWLFSLSKHWDLIIFVASATFVALSKQRKSRVYIFSSIKQENDTQLKHPSLMFNKNN